MTELIYYQDQYKKELEAKVVSVEGNYALLDKTIFIPQTNTEPGDFGKINGMKIAGSKKDGNNIWHIFSKPVSFKAGGTVKLELDWSKRLLAIRMHSALHLLAGAIEKNFGKRAVAGAVKGNQAELVLKEQLPDETITRAIEASNKDIESSLEIKSYWDEKREGFRWTQIGEYPPIPDGGIHVKNTKEIGNLILVGKELNDGKQKIIIGINQE
ncbi:MAG: alanyl-tRNA editing protein [Nanoarchaeota archaeon]|nr:alanyl-tRNA editing protein [Nanoarchaeota archaeon]MBU4300281.1 alanyl-tRNA editing protein [Nanoarchaeota archaeon]MBU4452506.1 alanyl-tRNA editing protein [Nanoarchaeota archaeon]MCG2723211.1 alanyl-tRNA editing protein [archaeon]